MPWKGWLLDVGGVLQAGGRALPGAAEALAALRRRGVPFRLLSNTSSRSRATLAAELGRLGLAVGPGELLTATTATAEYLRRVGGPSLLLVGADARADLAGCPEDREHPAHVVLGDTPEAFGRPVLNAAFRALRGGADLVAMARNRWYAAADGPAIDIGALVAALEYAAEVRATVVGKPAASFFLQGVAALGLQPGEVAMVGDDPEADVVGAMDAGLGGVFVGPAEAWGVRGRRPAARLGGVGELPGLL